MLKKQATKFKKGMDESTKFKSKLEKILRERGSVKGNKAAPQLEEDNRRGMKFKDPLATIQYMGGTIPNHVVMAIYSMVVYRNYVS